LSSFADVWALVQTFGLFCRYIRVFDLIVLDVLGLVCRWQSVEKVVMVDLDEVACKMCQEHLPEWNTGVYQGLISKINKQ